MNDTPDDNLSIRSMQYAAGRPRLIARHGHPVDRNLPAHWERIEPGQTSEERSAAILVNIALDDMRRPISAPISGTRALARIAAVTRRSPN
ncbi:MAG: hypothetical protein JWN80_1390 [Microbacteriaceae bacterium]|nr:hypothetical protein [Microbacteriaceae bacterium]